MTGAQLKTLRESRSWSQQDLAEHLNGSLGRSYSSSTISTWELEKRKVPGSVVAFLEALPVIDLANDLDGGRTPEPSESEGQTATATTGRGDATPAGPPGPSPASPPSLGLSPGTAYARVCTELFEMVAMGIGITGAALGNQALVNDGLIIDADKEKLGRAYGKLAETNETFRKLLQGATAGGAWVEIALVTSGTVSAMLRNHVEYAQHVQQVRAQQQDPRYVQPEQPAAAAA